MHAKRSRPAATQTTALHRAMQCAPRRFVFIGLLLACAATSTHAGKLHSLALQLADLQVPDTRWEEQQAVDMSGIPMHVRPFSSTLDATEVAQRLGSEPRRFQRLTSLGDTLMLSGLQADAHWLAKINASATGSSGYVSVLASGATQALPGGADLDVQGWLPDNAAWLYEHRSNSSGRTLAQYVYAISGPADVSMTYVRQQLRRQGWKHDPSFAGIGSGSSWRRKGSELTIFISAQHQGSALYIQHLE